MANSDGLKECLEASGTNEVISFEGGFFSFAHKTEIALVLDSGYYILNTGAEDFKVVVQLVKDGKSKEELIEYWLKRAETGDVSYWSNSFDELHV